MSTPFATDLTDNKLDPVPKVKGVFAPKMDADKPFGVYDNKVDYTSSAKVYGAGANDYKYQGKAKAKLGDSEGGVPYGTTFNAPAAGSAPAPHVPAPPFALANDKPAPVEVKKNMRQPERPTNLW